MAAAALAVLLLACRGRDEGPVRIGVAGSFSDPIGLPMKLAAELAAEEINASGGVGGQPLELVLRDDYADPDSAVFIAGDLYDSGVSAVVGHLFSGTTLAAAPVYNGGTERAVRRLQERRGVRPTGRMFKSTWTLLLSGGHTPVVNPYYGSEGLFTSDPTQLLTTQFMRQFPWSKLQMLKAGTHCTDPATECEQPSDWTSAKRKH